MAGASDYTIHNDEAKKQRYINRLKITKSGLKISKSSIDSAGFWSRWILWHLPTIKDSYNDINRRFNIIYLKIFFTQFF